ncbi:MAG: hypothetical protein SPF17_02750 [Candidatus Mucispirillum faecigallinarum]|nr:hypothetical protein [Candidatus Mucispirillum faecigallinarum]
MINFLKIFTAVLLCISITSCSSKTKRDDLLLGMTLVERAVDYQLQGRERMASYTYNRAVAKFKDMGNFCNMARTAIVIVTADPEESLPLLEDARAFAALGRCQEELNIVNFLSHNEYNESKLPAPYKKIAQFYKTGDISYLLSIAKSSSTSERIQSYAYRQAARHIVDNDPEYALELIEKAAVIDSKKTWTLNLVKDEKIRLNAVRNMGLPDDLIVQRLKILEQALNEKY